MTHDTTTQITSFGTRAQVLPGEGSLVLIYGADLGRRYPVEPELTVGRSLQNNLMLDADSISRRHAMVFHRGGAYYITDLGSTNGTLVNDRQTVGDTKLEHGDIITIGSVVFRFISGDNAESRYYEEIYRLTIIDGLTQIYNRRYFEEFLDRESSRFERTHSPFSIVLFDVDHFKAINDMNGHLAGDRVLREVARRCEPLVRREQLLARFGGDEFVLVLTDTAATQAITVAEKIRQRIADSPCAYDPGPSIPFTITAGVAEIRVGQSSDDLLQAADQVLYRAKEKGRNRVLAAES